MRVGEDNEVHPAVGEKIPWMGHPERIIMSSRAHEIWKR